MPVLGVGLVVALLPGSGSRWGGEGGGGGRGGLPGAEILDCWHASAPAKHTAAADAWQKSVCKKEARFARSRQRTLPRPREAAVSSGSSGIWATSEISTSPNTFPSLVEPPFLPQAPVPFLEPSHAKPSFLLEVTNTHEDSRPRGDETPL